ncbi:rho guanine nucleotide exchange factor at 64c isoform a [Anaeramoeba ignava]|uniref:Rho guanine nucleotide exchange factor at 64c isoform a n=1 Tax=Anaeramoeba ignava TaxID=1746090 RepID=A0A9Q0LPM3_ANAIG|nr:rho guanine nucleotide exchange factor at 64c isoform a [Anaeramoeba ignava]
MDVLNSIFAFSTLTTKQKKTFDPLPQPHLLLFHKGNANVSFDIDNISSQNCVKGDLIYIPSKYGFDIESNDDNETCILSIPLRNVPKKDIYAKPYFFDNDTAFFDEFFTYETNNYLTQLKINEKEITFETKENYHLIFIKSGKLKFSPIFAFIQNQNENTNQDSNQDSTNFQMNEIGNLTLFAPNTTFLFSKLDENDLVIINIIIQDKLTEEKLENSKEKFSVNNTFISLNSETKHSTIEQNTYSANDDPFKTQRNEVGNTIIEKEKKYFEDLKILRNRFLEPLRDDDQYSSEKFIENIFHNIEEIINLNSRIVVRMDQELESQEEFSIIKIFSNFEQEFYKYIIYISNYESAKKSVKRTINNYVQFKEFLEKIESEADLSGRDLKSLLYLPVSRAASYLEDFFKLTKFLGENNPETKALESLVSKFQEIVDQIQQSKIKESQETEEIKKGGKLNAVISGFVMEKENKKNKKYIQYEIDVSTGYHEWKVFRRYSEFRQLHSVICKNFPNRPKLSFPSKTLRSSLSYDVVTQRKAKLNRYLSIILNDKNMRIFDKLFEFLEVF